MQNTHPDFQKITFGEWLSLWFETYKKPYLAENSVRNIEQIIRIHTPEWLKQLPIKDITLFDIDRALSSVPKSRTQTYMRQVWNSAFSKAERLCIVDKNVVALTDSAPYKKKKSMALTIKEQRDFLQALETSKFKWLMLFYLYTGVRRAEALSLEWKDIDYDNNLILIKGTKTDDSFRHILLTKELKEILDGRKKQAKKDGVKSNRVFPYALQTPSKVFKKLCPNHHLHDLRHTFITRCAECGVNVNVCQQVVGHATADMTLNVYMHVLDDFKRKEMEKFNLFPTF